MASQARGLQNFISDLRNAKSKEEETRRIDKELANIRKKFTPSGNKVGEDGNNTSLSSYQRKKYVWKLVYIHVLGYDVDFGHPEVLTLVRSQKYSEKHVGYTALSLLLRGDDPMINSVVSTIRKDLTTQGSGKNGGPAADAVQSLALCSIANMSGLELIQTLHGEVQNILVSKDSTANVKKKAALCLLRLVRTSPNLLAGREFAPHVAQLLQDRHLGVLTSAMGLLNGLASQHTSEYESLIPYVVHILGMLVLKRACAREYLYYRTPSPWLQIKLLKFLQMYPQAISPPSDNGPNDSAANKACVSQLTSVVSKILTETDVSDSINKSNADHAILFEAVSLIVVWGSAGPIHLRDGAMKLLGKFISVREPNIRYLGLMTMAKLAQLDGSSESIKKHQATVLVSLKDADISVRRRALDLLFVMCDTDNAERIVDELVAHLVLADAAIREEMVLKIAILAEKYATDLRWYVDTILKLISISGDHVSDAIWHRVVQIVTNHPQGDLQAYAAATLLVGASPRRCHETAVRIAAYVLGEFGFLIAERPGMSGEEQFRILHQHWATSDQQTRAILISTYAKLANLYEECRPLVAPVFARCKNSVDIEIQQRSAEYSFMREAFSPEAVEDLLREMPPFEDRRQSALEQRLKEKEGDDSAAVMKATRPSPAQKLRAAESAAAARAAEEAAMTEDNETSSVVEEEKQDESNERDQIPTVGIPKEVIPAMRKAFSNLCTSQSGVLFENTLLQVGVKHEYVGAQGRISVFFGNVSEKSAKTPLHHFRVVVDEVEHLRIQKQGTEGLLDDDVDGGCTVAVRTQAKLLLLVEVTAPFDDAPAMRVMFETEDGAKHEYPLRLPVVATCFMEPVTLEPAAFMQRWKSLEGQDRECQEVVKAPANAPPIDEEYMSRIAKIITEGLKFGRCAGCDPTPW
eukprot:CAMPEP_0178920078 /NCGR_PEP_ID=MMETSP0786-20121207/14801_1 /TAXON_ID=186022 /ORGANISM="Thalassionema frauenfeldii, Strain CCMP 1798" /LENGTH=920 /DNA_ID=CAMNT_0020594097 /DNA_START=188 /DNA_END=2947 /DNA_ORIENTATION=-